MRALFMLLKTLYTTNGVSFRCVEFVTLNYTADLYFSLGFRSTFHRGVSTQSPTNKPYRGIKIIELGYMLWMP